MSETQPAARTRTFTWQDPLPVAAAAATTAGVDLLQALITGQLPPPPALQALGVQALEADQGRAVLALDPQEFHYNPLGTVHGGVLATVLDTAAGCAVHCTLPAGTSYTSLDLSVRVLRPVTVGSGRLHCQGTVLTRGNRTAVAEARLTDTRDRLVAHATSTCLIMAMHR